MPKATSDATYLACATSANDGWLIIESLTPDVPESANFLKPWGRVEVDQDTLTRDGLWFLRGLCA